MIANDRERERLLTRQKLTALDMMREFAAKAQPLSLHLKNLRINGTENINKRVWALRLHYRKSSRSLARQLGIKYSDYLSLERIGTRVSGLLISKLSRIYAVPEDWLLCRKVFYPIPSLPGRRSNFKFAKRRQREKGNQRSKRSQRS